MNKLEKFNKAYEEVLKENNLECILLEIKMPTGEIETIINPNIHEKVKYVNKTYDNDLRHANCKDIQIVDYLFITRQAYDFSWALSMLKDGFRVRRKGWNGKGLEIALQPGYDVVKANKHTREVFDLEKDTEISVMPYFQILNRNTNEVNTWVPSVSDCLAEDWEVVE